MIAGRDDVSDVLRKWRDEESVIRAEVRLGFVSFTMDGRIISLRDNELRIASPNLRSEFNLRLTSDFIYDYEDNRNVTGTAKEYREAIAILVSTEADGDSNTIVLGAK